MTLYQTGETGTSENGTRKNDPSVFTAGSLRVRGAINRLATLSFPCAPGIKFVVERSPVGVDLCTRQTSVSIYASGV